MKRTGVDRPLRFGSLLLIIVLFLHIITPIAGAEERKSIRVGFFAFDGYHMMDENGERSGYGYEFLRMAARFLDVDYEYVGYGSGWDDMLDMLRDGRIDLVTSAQVTSDRLEEFAYSKPIGVSSAMLTVKSTNRTIVAGNYSSYNGMRVGLLNGNSRNEDLAAFARLNGFHYTPVYFELAEDMEEALQLGKVDAVCTSSLRETQNEHILDLFDPHDFYVIVRKDDVQLLSSINYAIEQLNMTEGDWKSKLNNRHYEHLEERNLTFSAREQELIAQYARGEKKLVVTASMDRAPYTYVENGRLKGIIVDYFDKLAEYAGIPYEYVVPASREEYQRWQQDGTVNVFIDSRISSERWIEENGFAYSQPYVTMRLAMVTRRDFDGDIQRLAIAGAQGEFGIEKDIAPHAVQLAVDTRTQAMQAVMDGKADAAIVYLYTVQQFVNQDERGLLTYTLLQSPAYDYHVGFTRGVSHELAGIFTKAIYAMDDGLFEEIATTYTGYRAEDMDLRMWIKIYPITTIIMCTFLFFACICIIIMYTRRRTVHLEKRRAAQLQALAEEAERAKSDFLANVSHDIRTPMNAIIGYANLLEYKQDDAEVMREYIRKIKYSSRHLLSLIDDVLDMSRIEANQIRLSPTFISLQEQIQQVKDITQPAAVEHKQDYQVRVRNLTHDAVLCDGARLRQVLLNLLSNAVKYTPDGGKIELVLDELPYGRGGYGQYRFCVKDTGHGVSPEFQKRIFEPFARGEASVTNKVQGSGLGMAITKNIVNRMGGKITIRSVPEQGSCFEVTLVLPFATEEAKQADKKQTDALAGKRFLCAEDNAINAEILKELLLLHGARCDIYPDGAQLVKAFERVKPGEYDAILMDVQMPNMNGLDACRAIRTGENPVGWTIPIIAMTTSAFMENVRQSLDAGMNAHISKPISPDMLENTIAQLCGADPTAIHEEERA